MMLVWPLLVQVDDQARVDPPFLFLLLLPVVIAVSAKTGRGVDRLLDMCRTTLNVTGDLAELFDLILTQDSANCHAKADIKLGDTVIAGNIPATYLLFLEKKLIYPLYPT